jgi:putative transposase
MRFYSCPVDDTYLWTAMRYIERNPVRARMVATPWDYPWSSASSHVTGNDATGLLDMDTWRMRCPLEAWRRFCGATESEASIALMREQTVLGLPLATEKTLHHLEEIGMSMRRPKMGRPRKQC